MENYQKFLLIASTICIELRKQYSQILFGIK